MIYVWWLKVVTSTLIKIKGWIVQICITLDIFSYVYWSYSLTNYCSNSESNSEAQNNLNENNADERNSEILDELNKEPMVHDDTPDVKIELQEVKEEATDNQENIETNEANLAVSNFDSHTNGKFYRSIVN